jgi:hypothetical protein
MMKIAIVDIDFLHANFLIKTLCHPAGVTPTLYLCDKQPPNSEAVAGLVSFCLAHYDLVAVPLMLYKEIPLQGKMSTSRLICPAGCGFLRENTIYIDQPPYSENVIRRLVQEVTK